MLREKGSNIWLERGGVEHPLSLPSQEARDWAKHLPIIPDCLIVLWGMGYGWEVRALLEVMSKRNQVCIVEADDAVLEVFKKNNSDIKIPLMRVRDWKEFKQALLLAMGDWENFTLAANPCYVKLWPLEFNLFKERALREIQCLRNDQATARYFAPIWQENILRNLPTLVSSGSVKSAFGAWSKKPMILISAGSSLMQALPLLKRVGKKALICATQTTNRLFEKVGFHPHLIFSFDGDYPNWYQHFKNVELNVPLVFDPTVNWRCVEGWKGPKVGMLVHPGNRWIEERTQGFAGLFSGPSIANTIYHFGVRIGADPIILVGQDLSYTQGRFHAPHTHAPGMEVWDSEISLEFAVHLVQANNGANVITNGTMLSALHWFEEVFKVVDNPPLVINTSLKGAKIEGTTLMSLEATLDEYCRDTQPVGEFISLMMQKPLAKSPKSYLQEARVSLRKLIPELEKGILLCEQDTDKASVASLKEIDCRVKEAAPYLECIHYRLRPEVSSLPLPEEAVKKESRSFYQAILSSIQDSISLVEEAYEKLAD